MTWLDVDDSLDDGGDDEWGTWDDARDEGSDSWGLDPEDSQDGEGPSDIGEGDGGDDWGLGELPVWAGLTFDERAPGEDESLMGDWRGAPSPGMPTMADEGIGDAEGHDADQGDSATDVSWSLVDGVWVAELTGESTEDVWMDGYAAGLAAADGDWSGGDVEEAETYGDTDDDEDEDDDESGEGSDGGPGMGDVDTCQTCGGQLEAGAQSNYCPVCSGL